MNAVLKPFIHRFVLVFFDDILVFGASWSEHLQHVKLVFEALRSHNLALKCSKCSFGASSVTYLGHVVSAGGVAMDSSKVEAVASWPRPKTVKALCGFLELAGYYRKFIAGYDAIAVPLTALLKQGVFPWTSEAERAFVDLKHALTTAPVLQPPAFDRQFVVDYDASGTGFGAVLHQGDGAVAYFSHTVAPHHTKLPAYERELIRLVKVVRH